MTHVTKVTADGPYYMYMYMYISVLDQSLICYPLPPLQRTFLDCPPIIMHSMGVRVGQSSGFNDVVMRSWNGCEAPPTNSIGMTSTSFRLVDLSKTGSIFHVVEM